MKRFCAALVVMAAFCLVATGGEAADPRIAAALKNARAREDAMERFDCRFTYEVRSPGADAWSLAYSGRWIRDGAKLATDIETKALVPATPDAKPPYATQFYHEITGYDGKQQRIYNAGSKHGNVFPDTKDYLRKRWECSPLSLGVAFSGQLLSEILKAEPLTVETPQGTITAERPIAIVGEQEIEGRRCVIVEQTPVYQGESHGKDRFFLAKELGYAPVSHETYIKDGAGELILLGKWTANKFREIRDGVWYPVAGRGETYRDGVKAADISMEIDITFPELIDLAVFTPEFPIGTKVYDVIASLEYVVGAAPDDVLETVPSIVSTAESLEESPAAELPEPAAPQPAASQDTGDSPAERSYGLYGVILCAGLAAVLGVIMLSRKIRRGK